MDKILVVEDQTEIRAWIVRFVGEVFPLAHFVEAVSVEQARKNIDASIDLLLVDLSLPDGRGDELIKIVKHMNPHIPCVVISSFEDDDFLFPALKAGADGYLLKDQTEQELKILLTGIVNGKPPLSPAIAYRLFDFFREPADDVTEVNLTEREKETLRLIAKGYSVKECARMMDISHYTVAGYIKEIYRKLQVNSRAEVALEAARLGLN
jgi:DNA-binding NarL/FixJ family response regulator